MAKCSDCFNFGDCLQHEGTKYYGLDAACNNVEELCENFKNKADFVEVVRCAECKHSCVIGVCPFTHQVIYECLKGAKEAKGESDFCSCGERKDE